MQVFLSRNNATDEFELVEMYKSGFKLGDDFKKVIPKVGI